MKTFRILAAKQIASSRNGNPRMEFDLQDVEGNVYRNVKTKTDHCFDSELKLATSEYAFSHLKEPTFSSEKFSYRSYVNAELDQFRGKTVMAKGVVAWDTDVYAFISNQTAIDERAELERSISVSMPAAKRNYSI